MAIDLYSYSACLGTLVINWKKRTVEFSGMDGNGAAEMTVGEIREILAEHADNPDIEVMPMIFWPENEQLAVHDADSFESEVDRDRESRGEDDEEEDPDAQVTGLDAAPLH